MPPLSGIRVLDFSELAPGPYMTQCLHDMGAEVIKIERPNGDMARTLQPGGFAALNHGKHSRFLDPKDPDACREAVALAREVDVLVEGFQPRVLAKFGLSYADLTGHNPKLVYVSITGFGQTGPLADLPGHDINYLAASGLASLCGGADSPPSNTVGVPIGDFCAGLYALSSALAALWQAKSSGRGQWLDVSITDCLAHWMNVRLGQFDERGLRSLQAQRDEVFIKPAYGLFATADGQVAIAALEDVFWRRLINVLPLELGEIETKSHAQRVMYAAQINKALASYLIGLSSENVLQRLRDADVPATQVTIPAQLSESPHFKQRELFETVGGRGFVRFPVRMEQ